ncbi:MAG: flippase-like domain-containing protein, partial [candidate division WOR-3 bacterium]|nr:flippase-like domain-containing protein [candidate division WOR-3 bacterium]
MSKRIFNVLRLIITIGLCYYLIKKIDLATTVATFRTVNVLLFTVGFFWFLMFLLICNWRWKILLDARGVNFSFGYLFKVYLVSWFFNNILPTTIGGDVFRIVYTVPTTSFSNKSKTALAFAVTFIDRFVGIIGLFFFALSVYFGFIRERGLESRYLPFLLLGFFLLLFLLFVMFSEGIYQKINWLIKRITVFNLGAKFDKAYEAIKDFRNLKTKLIFSFILSLFVQLTLAMVWYFCALSVSKSLSLVYYLYYIPIIGVITMIPISIGGLGLRENLFVSIFSLKGLASNLAGTISILFLIIN